MSCHILFLTTLNQLERLAWIRQVLVRMQSQFEKESGRSLSGQESPSKYDKIQNCFRLIDANTIRANGDSHVEKMKSLAGGGGKFKVGGQMGAEGVKLGHQRKHAEEVISREKEICNTFWIRLRVATVIN